MNLIHQPKISIKKFTGAGYVPTASQLGVGELGVNSTDSRVYTKNQSGVVVDVGSNGGGSISSLTDVQLTSLANDNFLKYNTANSKWVNSSALDGGNF
tara:strand:+ start:1867 stop:2160 length:294 start_codon:yes stop_codon:yes gene_type:complete